MSGLDNKKSKRRKAKKAAVTKAANPNKPVPSTDSTSMDGESLKNLEKLMDAHDDDAAMKMLSFPRGSNPFLDRERCLLCNCERQDPPEADAIREESTESQCDEINPLWKLPLWVCSTCRKAADQEIEKKPCIEQLLEHDFDENFLPDISIKSGSEPTTPNGSICTCEACTERRMIESEHEQETAELQHSWTELRMVVRCHYGGRDEQGHMEETCHLLAEDESVKTLVHQLCSRDPHQLFLRLESQVREFVIEMKVKLLKQLSTGFKTPPQAKLFITMLLEEYAHLCKMARKMAGLLKELQEHLKRFKVTWDLHNKHLFQSIVFSEPSIKNSINLLISQLRLGAASKESYNEDTYPNLLHRYLKFEDEMSVINVVWRDCHQLIESYNEEQSALKLKQKMLREDWEFFKTQRKLLEQQVSKNPKASLSHNLEAQFTETMRLMLQGNKPTQEELLCPRCNRKRCPCDECTITHMITCGIINPDVLENATSTVSPVNTHNGNFLHDPNRYRIDVSPPSMSSTTSSSGSSSPIFIDPDRLRTHLKDGNRLEDEIREDDMDNQSFDDEDDDDDDVDDDDDDADNEEEPDSTEKDESDITFDLPSFKGMVEISSLTDEEAALRRSEAGKLDSCNCDHCVSQAKLEQVMKAEDNQCQCHVCLQQQGKAISTSLPQHVPPIVPRPGELHLYPHIHGSTGLHSLGRGHVRPLLQPNLYDLHLNSTSQRHKSIIQQTKVPLKLDFDTPEAINNHIYHAYGDWDNTTYDPRLLLGSGKFDSELLPPPPFTSPYTSNLLTEPMPLSMPGVFNASSNPISSVSQTSSAFMSTMATHNAAVATAAVAQSGTTKVTDNLSVIKKELLAEELAKFKCTSQGSMGKTQTPPCTRPATIGGNNTPKVLDKGQHQHCRKHNPQANTKTGTLPNHNHASQLPMKMTPEFMQTKEGRQMVQQFANTLKQPNVNNHPCSHANANNNKSSNHMPGAKDMCANANSVQLPTTVNNVSVGTSTLCTERDCDGIHDDDSVDDNCSEKSSSTTNSTSQKEGKYCDCCYCEFFGHGNPPVAPTSKNYAEMRDKLRLRLKKKNDKKTDSGVDIRAPGGMPNNALPSAHTQFNTTADTSNTIPLNERNVRLFQSVLQNETKGPEDHPLTPVHLPQQQTQQPAQHIPPSYPQHLPNKCMNPLVARSNVNLTGVEYEVESPSANENQDPLETKGLDELIRFINGTDDSDKKLSSKAAKRARQKQRKVEEKARQEAEERAELERQREILRMEEIQRKLTAEAEKLKKLEGMTKRQRKQAAKLAKSSSSSPTPASTGSSVNSSNNNTLSSASSDVNTSGQDTNTKMQKKKGKHKDADVQMLQVNITCEIEHNSTNSATVQKSSGIQGNTVPTNDKTSGRNTPQSGKKQKLSAPVNSQSQHVASRPTPQGSSNPTTSIPTDIDNRILINTKVNKNMDPARFAQFGNGDFTNGTSLKPEQIAQITRQQQELLKKQTQHLIQLKLQQEAKKQMQIAQQQQQQQQQTFKTETTTTAKGRNINIKFTQPSMTKPTSQSPAVSSGGMSKEPTGPKSQLQQSKNNIKITVKNSSINGVGGVHVPTSSLPNYVHPSVLEQNNNNNKQGVRIIQQNLVTNIAIGQRPNLTPSSNPQQTNAVNSASSVQSTQQTGRKGKKIIDGIPPQMQLNHHQHAQFQQQQQQGQVTTKVPQNHMVMPQSRQSPGPNMGHLQNGGTPRSPSKGQGYSQQQGQGQTRQAPQGQARNGDVRPRSQDRGRQDVNKGKQDDSPPSDQGKNSSSKSRKMKKKKGGAEDINFIDEVFMPKSESDLEGGDMDEYEKEIEEFKRFCADSSTPVRREKLQVNVNIKDIFSKKKAPLSCN